MPVLAVLMVSMGNAFGDLFVKVLGIRAAVAAAHVAALAVLMAALAAGISAIAAAVALAMPSSSWLMTGLYFGIPSNAAVCMAAWLSVDAFCVAYRIGVSSTSAWAGAARG